MNGSRNTNEASPQNKSLLSTSLVSRVCVHAPISDSQEIIGPLHIRLLDFYEISPVVSDSIA